MGQVGRFARVFPGGGELPSDGIARPVGEVELRGMIPKANKFFEVDDGKATRDVKLKHPSVVGRGFSDTPSLALREVEDGWRNVLGGSDHPPRENPKS